jgi:SAM-dependent methyltransferase
MKKLFREAKRIARNVNVGLNNIVYEIVNSKVECNLCHYKTRRFASSTWHLYTNCQQCRSGVRHRLLWATFEHLEQFSLKKIIENKNVLHFAPEKILSELISRHAREYKKADYLAEGYYFDQIDYNIDISDMPIIENESFDCVIACDVLEHVQNHVGGMKELYRILKKGGYCILTVPQRDNLDVTFEDPTINTTDGRKNAYGQADHLRIYGNDFNKMLEDCGFEVSAISKGSFADRIVERNVLFPPVLSEDINATNYRNIFIGKKI